MQKLVHPFRRRRTTRWRRKYEQQESLFDLSLIKSNGHFLFTDRFIIVGEIPEQNSRSVDLDDE